MAQMTWQAPDELVILVRRAADLLASAGRPRSRPADDDLARARQRAGQGHQLADLVRDGRE